MTDFEMSARHDNYLRKIKKKWEDEGKRYNDTIIRMKEFREENYKKKKCRINEKIKKKRKTFNDIIRKSK